MIWNNSIKILSLPPRFGRWLLRLSAARVQIVGAPYSLFGIIGALHIHAIAFFASVAPGTLEYTVICYLQAFCSSLGFFLVFHGFWARRLTKFLPLFWHITLMFSLPFSASLLCFLLGFSSPSLIYFLVSLFFLGTLVDWASYLVISSVGILLAVVVNAQFFHKAAMVQDVPYVSFILGNILILINGVIFSRIKERSMHEKTTTLKTIAGTLAHEIRTPLSSISLTARSLEDQWPALIAGKTHQRMALLNDVPKQLVNASNDAMNIVEMLLGRIYDTERQALKKIISIDDCVAEALSEYRFSREERELIKWRRNDAFNFLGRKNPVVQILFNLMSNSLYYIKNNNKGHIEIWYEQSERNNQLHFRDSAIGISDKDLPYIFDFSFSRRAGGEGVGLFFCKNAMRALDGHIECLSSLGKFTEFILVFPRE